MSFPFLVKKPPVIIDKPVTPIDLETTPPVLRRDFSSMSNEGLKRVVIDSMYRIPKDVLSLRHWKKIQKELTLQLSVSEFFTNQETEQSDITFYHETETDYVVPRFFGIAKFGYTKETRWNCSEGENISEFVRYQGSLEEARAQPEAVRKISISLRNTGGAILWKPPGMGKTNDALYVWSEIVRRKALWVTHKSFLMDQVAERILQFVPSAKIGRIQQDECVVEGCDIVLATVQTLYRRNFPLEFRDQFGLLVIDEVHHYSTLR